MTHAGSTPTTPAGALRPRVLRIITRLNIGGPSIQAGHLTTMLPGRGFDTRLIHGRLGHGEGDMRYLLPPEADVRHLPALCRPIAPVDDLRALIRLVAEMRAYEPRIVHTHMAKAGTLGRLAAALYNMTRGRRPRARVIHTYHGHVLEGYFSPAATFVFLSLERLLARLSDVLIAISPAIRSELLDDLRIGRRHQYRVVPLGFDLTHLAAIDDAFRAAARERLGVPQSASVVVTVGRLTAIKQHRLFLDVVAKAAAMRDNVMALIAGDGELRGELEDAARGFGLDRRVRFLGWRRDLEDLYAASDVFLLTSRNEGTPVAIIEAMAAGVPPVSTDVGGVRDVIDSPLVGLLAPFGDVERLAEAVLRLLGDDVERRAMGARARARVMAAYSIDRLVDDIVGLYDELTAS
jgi:glycosyltransferase involved in cell wall biosynthesis